MPYVSRLSRRYGFEAWRSNFGPFCFSVLPDPFHLGKGFDIRQVLFAAGCILHRLEMGDGGDEYLCYTQMLGDPALPQLVEGHGGGEEDIDVGKGRLGVTEGECHHAFFIDPALPGRRIKEFPGIGGHPRHISEAGHQLEESFRVIRVRGEGEVKIGRHAGNPVEVDGHAPHQHVADLFLGKAVKESVPGVHVWTHHFRDIMFARRKRVIDSSMEPILRGYTYAVSNEAVRRWMSVPDELKLQWVWEMNELLADAPPETRRLHEMFRRGDI